MTYQRPYESLQSVRNCSDKAPEQSDQFGQMCVPGTGHCCPHRIDQLTGSNNVQRDVDWKKRYPISQVGCLHVASEIHWNNDPHSLSLKLNTVQFRIASYGRSHDREYDVVNRRAAGLLDSFYFGERN